MSDPTRLLDGRYRLERLLGRGGMSQVWHAVDQVLGRPVAVKLLDLSTAEPAAVQWFRQEARTTAALSHTGIITVFDTGIHGRTPYLVMELLPGPTLGRLVAERGPMPVSDAARYAGQVCAALSAAHATGVVHGDLKPDNLMLAADGSVKVLDFGIAGLVRSATTRPGTGTPMLVGTPEYLAPEQIQGRPVDGRADLYALGCVLTALLTGRPPFTGADPREILGRQVSAVPASLREARPDVPPALADLVSRLLAKDPAARPATAEEVRRRLAALAAPPPPAENTTMVLGPVPAGAWSPDDAAAAGPRPRPWDRLPGGPVAVAGLAAVLFLLVVTILFAGGDDEPATWASSPGADQPGWSTPSASPTPTTPTPTPTATTRPPRRDGPEEALARVMAAVDDARAAGDIGPKAAAELDDRLEEVARKLDEGKRREAAKRAEEVEKKVEDFEEEGKIDEDAAEPIFDALEDLRDELPG